MAIDLNPCGTAFNSNWQFEAAAHITILAAAGMCLVFVVHSGFEACLKAMKFAPAVLPVFERI